MKMLGFYLGNAKDMVYNGACCMVNSQERISDIANDIKPGPLQMTMRENEHQAPIKIMPISGAIS